MKDQQLSWHPYCHSCRRQVQERYGSFKIRCQGIVVPERLLPPQVLRTFSPEEQQQLLGIYDPVLWATQTCNWYPRVSADGVEYQALMLRCTAVRKVFRCGRRIGKSDCIAIKALHAMATGSYVKVLLIAPYKAQIDIIFNRTTELIARSPLLQQAVRRRVATPYHEIEFHNGSYLRGFTSGARSGAEAGSIRGQAADIIILDEMDYLADRDIDAIAGILHDHPDTQLWASSTPTGRRGKFYEYCHSPRFKEFHFPAQVIPHWSAEMEAEAREQLTDTGYLREILAEFGEEEEGVFPKQYLDAALYNYRYRDHNPQPGWVYGLGVDWNSDAYGTEIIVVGWDGELLWVLDSINVGRQEWSQSRAMEAIIAQNRRWRPLFINADEGFGSVQVELLRKYGLERVGQDPVDARLKDIVQGVNFSSHIEVPDPITRQPHRKPLKPFMVENAVRFFEQHLIRLSTHDLLLINQLENYIISRRTPAGMPVYAPRSPKLGDHKVDALMLALLGFGQRFSTLLQLPRANQVQLLPRQGLAPGVVPPPVPQRESSWASRPRPEGRWGFVSQWGHPALSLWSWPGFLRDEPPPVSSRPGRLGKPPSRSNL